jgi:dipeptidyl aminopeptidase/acylaminoacyl peptidase
MHASELRRRLLLASPVERLPLSVPLLLVHGEAESDLPVEMSRRFAAQARRAGDRVTLCTLPGVGHYEHLDPASAAWTAAERWLRDRRLGA